MKKKGLTLILIVLAIIAILIVLNVINNDKDTNKSLENPNLTSMSSYEFPLETSIIESKKLRVLVVDIDPLMTKGNINGKSCLGITASQCLGQNKEQVIEELITDIEYSSHGTIDVEIVKYDYVNEFATHKTKATLLNGSKANKLDEDTWLELMKNGWYGFWNSPIYKEFGSYSLDYQYLIDKLNLVNRKNNNEFDEVWLVNVDPTMSYESIMVGRTAYWINGKEIIKDCENFKFMNVSISRPDTNYECNAHAAENIMNNVFGVNNYSYNSNNLNVNSSNYDKLNLWQKFTLVEYANKNKSTGLSGVGNVHFSPNSISDYDWGNSSNKIYSKWREWLNYPNLTSNPGTEIFDPNVYLNEKLEGTNSDARKHHRWWFSLMPHMTGYTNDGYSNNWWDYIFTGDFVVSIEADKKDYKYKIGDTVDDIEVINNYKSGKKEMLKLDVYEKNMSFSNKNIFSIDSNNKIVATSKGSSILKYYRDGKYIQINIIIE